MKKYFLIAIIAVALFSCKESNLKLTVTFPDDSYNGKTLFVTSYDTGEVIDSTTIQNSCAMIEQEHMDSTYMSRLIVDGNRLSIIIEPGELSLNWADGNAIGGVLNERLKNLALALDSIESDDDAIALFKQVYEENRDNGLGRWAFNYYLMYNDFTTSQIDSLLKLAPSEYRNLTRVNKAISDARQKEVTAIGKKFTDFTILCDDGVERKLSDFVGKGRLTLVDFWASWCGPCRHEIENTLKPIYDEVKGKMDFVGIAVWDEAEKTREAMEQLEITWPVVVPADNETNATNLYGISGIPHIVIFDKYGTIVSRGLQGEELTQKIKELVK